MGGQLLEEIKAFYGEVSACVKVNEEMSDSFDVRVESHGSGGVTGLCDVTMTVQYCYGWWHEGNESQRNKHGYKI